jgi:hypothetical protein
MKQEKSGIDYAELADRLDEVRETLTVMVAGITADGFTDEQARVIVASIFQMSAASAAKKTGDPDD